MTEHTLSSTTANSAYRKLQMKAAAVETPVPVVQDAMFFTLLNRDVRMSIYDFLYGWLPPLRYKNPRTPGIGPGMLLACKQANLELSEAAARHLKKHLDRFSQRFEKYHGHAIKLFGSIPLYQGWEALRTISLTLDIDYFTEALAEIAMIPEAEKDNWRRGEVLEKLELHVDTERNGKIPQWRALLLHPFDKVTLLITDASRDKDSDKTAQLEKYSHVVDILRDSLTDMGDQIAYDWLMFQDALDWDAICEQEDEYLPAPEREWYKTAELFRFARVQYKRLSDGDWREEVEQAGLLGNKTRRRIQTKQINFAWNFLPTTTTVPKKLVGKRHTYTAEHAEEMRKTDQLRELKYENQWPHKYEVAAADGLIGEMGIRHPKRWVLASEEYCEYYGMMEQLKDAEDVESKGIGMPLWKAKPRAKNGEGDGKAEETAEEEAEEEIDENVQEEVKEDVVIEVEEEMEEESESESESESEDDGDEDDDDEDSEDDEDDEEDDDEEEDQAEIEDEDGPGFQAVVRGGKQTKIPDFWKKA
ncbi:uncharacterized protein J4E92_010475 [Alternaria infectoria]|uniref:uncharacterized protein n=1 Tax=Alternaria infectoria TaxID=45303 RepID=UPI00221F6653|nr:uncharacterized protein J4E92_010475 [Alternaria infectoria]KAI4909859.1 hypothetical protein J4E92_010475 [Alternaria infectoria]